MSEIKTFSIERGATTLPAGGGAGALKALFTVSDFIRVHSIIGVVTTDIQAQANAMKLVANPTVGADVDLCAAGETNGDVIGTMYGITGTPANALVQATSGAMLAQADPVLVAPGTIDIHCVATNSGAAKWTIVYSPVMASATVKAA